MGKSRRHTEPVVVEKVFTDAAEIDQAIRKLQRRLDEVRGLEPSKTAYNDPRVYSAGSNISDTVMEIYGPNSPDYHRFQSYDITHSTIVLGGRSEAEAQREFARGWQITIEDLGNLIRRLEEKKADFGADAVARVRTAFEGLDLHPRIAAVSVDLYRNGHYADAVLKASLPLENFVKEKSGRYDVSGSPLMEQVFSPNGPVLAFNTLADQSDRDEQRGMMLLFQGTIFAFRNPRAHKLLEDSPEEELESIALISLLAKRLEQAKPFKKP